MGMIYGSLRYDVTGRKKRNYARKTKYLAREGVFMSLSDIIDAGVCLSTPHVPIQLELPLAWKAHVIQEPLSKVSEPCTSQMQFR